MARMIPAVIDPDTKSPGEREVFQRLRDDPATQDWTVLHSFGLPRHQTQVEGEVDFVVLVPSLGVLCLEIKAHRSVSRSNEGTWVLGQDAPTSRSPFKQASDNMRSLMELLARLRKEASEGVVFWQAVIFTHTDFRIPAVEWREWEVIDQGAFHGAPISELLTEVLVHAHGALPGR